MAYGCYSGMEIFLFAFAVVGAYGWLGAVVINYFDKLSDQLDAHDERLRQLENEQRRR